ncbi:MAG: hypothetical protein ABI425_03990 [Patescibacteria group bacterium]
MSLTILHGEHQVNSRAKLVELMEVAKQKDLQVHHLETTGLTTAILEAELGSQDMFGSEKVLVIESIFSGPKSKKKEELLVLVGKYADSNQIILWESKKLTPAQQKKFPNATQQLFALSSSLFEWLDSLHGPIPRKLKLLQQAAIQDGAEFCFAMFVRQVRLLLLIKSGEPMKEHPFVVKKLQQQARSFTLQQLIDLHEQLTFLDFHLKTGQSKLGLQQELEQLMLR